MQPTTPTTTTRSEQQVDCRFCGGNGRAWLDDIGQFRPCPHTDRPWFVQVKGSNAWSTLKTMYSTRSGADHQVRSLHLSERSLHFKVLFHDLRRWDPSHTSDELKVGIVISNSEVGCRSVTIRPFVYRYACTNDMIFKGDGELVQRHAHLNDDELNRRAAKAVGKCLEVGDELLDRVVDAHSEPVESPMEVIRRLAQRRKLSDKATQGVLDTFDTEPMGTRFGIMQAFTGYATKLQGDERVDMETIGGALLTAKLPQVAAEA